ncbi:MAG: hypothetical protein PHY30_01395 [Candidatus Pacebacteria bacterium]|nr:hypothetical protein [Candidatus Paceibacterota bacterium]
MTTNVNKKNSAPLPIILIAFGVVMAVVAIALATGVLSPEHTNPSEQISESPPEMEPAIQVFVDPLQERMKKMAEANYNRFLDSWSPRHAARYTEADFNNEFIVVDDAFQAPVGPISKILGTKSGFYTGPLIFFYEGREVKVIEQVFLGKSGGVLIDRDLKWDRIESLKEFPYPDFFN